MRFSRRHIVIASMLVALAAVGAGCGADEEPAAATPTATPTPTRSPAPTFTGEAGRVAAAVRGFGAALQRGDVERICTPNAILTGAAISQLNQPEDTCEQFTESRIEASGTIALAAQSINLRPDLAVANIRRPDGSVVALTLLKARARWLVSFDANEEDPVTAVLG